MGEVITAGGVIVPNGDLAGITNSEYITLRDRNRIPSCRLNGGNTTLATGVTGVVTFQSVSYSAPGYLTGAVNGITVLKAGLYLWFFELLWNTAAAPAGERVAIMFNNGVTQMIADLQMADTVANANSTNRGVTQGLHAAGDVVSLQARHTQGANLGIATDGRTNMHGMWLGT